MHELKDSKTRVAAEKSENAKLAKLLLKHGATPPPKLSEEGEKLIQGVQREIEQKKSEERVFLAAYLKPENDKSLIQALPVELAKKNLQDIASDPEFSLN